MSGGWSLKTLPDAVLRPLLARLRAQQLTLVQLGGGDARHPLFEHHLLANWTPDAWRVVFEEAALLVGIDSWSAHFAVLLDTPRITFYGATHPANGSSVGAFTHNRSPKLDLLPAVACSPCESLVCTKTPGAVVCAGYLAPDWAAVDAAITACT